MQIYTKALVTENSTFDSAVSNTTESFITETEQTVAPSEAGEIARILNLVIRPVLVAFGTIGNSLSFYIMRQGLFKKMSTCFYLSVIAMADTSNSCVNFCFEYK